MYNAVLDLFSLAPSDTQDIYDICILIWYYYMVLDPFPLTPTDNQYI